MERIRLFRRLAMLLCGQVKTSYIWQRNIIWKMKSKYSKPDEFYKLIEEDFEQGTRMLEIFGRKNNLKSNWMVVGDEL
eukprot:snap_masked-scaffold_28-processed-gene-4.13-mRNA-1 protein AED:1.00 eAED:1.00 QI:0/0/0/0/1/1/2/0/77